MQINLNTQDMRYGNTANQNSKPSFKGFVSENFKNFINKRAEEDVAEFLNTSLCQRTEAEVENEILKPIKTTYRKLTEIMKNQFPDDIGVTICGNTPIFALKHKDNTLQSVYLDQWSTIWKTKDFIRFVAEISEHGKHKPSKIAKYAEYYRNEKANELLNDKYKNLRITD